MTEFYLSKQDVEDLVIGAAILGTGGGGDPYIGKLMVLQELEKGRKIRVVGVDDVDDEAFVVPVAAMGTPVVLIEKIPSGKEALYSLKLLENYFKRKVDFISPIEAGGINSTIPLVIAAERSLPVIDADGMGRAFPELQMVTYHVYGIKASPMAISDERGNAAILDTVDNFWAEKIARVITVKFGGSAWIAIYPTFGKPYKEAAIRGSISLAIEIGRALRESKAHGENPIDALLDVTHGFMLFKGKIVDIQRFNIGGFARGEATIEGLDEHKGSKLVIRFQNENLVAIRDGEIMASVPDLITVLDSESGKPITTERLRYGLRVIVIGIPCNEKWRTPKGLETVGPKYFGYDIDYVPIEVRMRKGDQL
ncbi:DUF917 domain-containing protein [Vulcanisaeta souniana]|uniref:DUF917 domain-containing protein n=1 Tax=Vulcanisaeta souniana JCM 11219 TaxID=1293586 RepID=A0A830E3U5_9CREN|nr:DUF917 domain-containing protein [Vulcanisaeta souniana]BDR91024.1 hypothetical protein Vsou_01170 [Vulcanisaeta souniana JCM 11219]GGI80101.1 hypothetical protein GCM10007112_16320 [Vulcanisaeta souniana JCM 11219]